MASPQIENGFTKIANDLFNEILKRDFSKRQLKVILAIIRFTYGFNRKEAELSVRFLEDKTGIKFNKISSILKQLQKMQVIVFIGNDSTISRKISLIKDYDLWKITSSQIGHSSQKGNELVPKKGTISVPKLGTKKESNKEILNKDIIKHELQLLIKKEYPEISKLQKQLTQFECDKLLKLYNKDVIIHTLDLMENYKGLSKKYKSVFLTLNNWLKRNDISLGNEKNKIVNKNLNQNLKSNINDNWNNYSLDNNSGFNIS